MEPGVGRHRRDRHHVADLGEELLPPLMGKHLLERCRTGASLDRSSPRDGISERVVGVVVAPSGGEVDMIRESLGGQLTGQSACEEGIASGGVSRHRCRRLHRKPRQGLAEFLRSEQRTTGCPGRGRGKGTRGKWAEAILQCQRASHCEYAPLIEIAPSDLTFGKRLDDLRAIITRLLRFTLTSCRCLRCEVHVSSPSFAISCRLTGTQGLWDRRSTWDGCVAQKIATHSQMA